MSDVQTFLGIHSTGYDYSVRGKLGLVRLGELRQVAPGITGGPIAIPGALDGVAFHMARSSKVSVTFG